MSGPTTYSYDGNGAQTGSSGPGGQTTSSYNDLGQLTRTSGPGGQTAYVYDAQGDRLGSQTPGSSPQFLTQDLATGGLSSLASNGRMDYAFLELGAGQAPLGQTTGATGQTTYLGTDLLGSVRVALGSSGQVVGAGAYDAWGTARPTTAGGAGQALLTGLGGATTFGYAGQYRDATRGTYAMRAREYDPAQGRFLSVDPLLAQTGQPYQYANNNPVNNTDPSGRWSVPAGQGADGTCWTCGGSGLTEQAAERSLEGMFVGVGAYHVRPRTAQTTSWGTPGYALTIQQLNARLPGYFAFNVPVAKVKSCNRPGATRFIANIWDPVTHEYWDIEHAGDGASAMTGIDQVVRAIRTNGLLWPKKDRAANVTRCDSPGGGACLTDPSVPNQAYACGDGVDYYECFGASLDDLVAVPDPAAHKGSAARLDAALTGSDFNPFTSQRLYSIPRQGAYHFYCTDNQCEGGYEWVVQAPGLLVWNNQGAVPGNTIAPRYVDGKLNALDFVLSVKRRLKMHQG